MTGGAFTHAPPSGYAPDGICFLDQILTMRLCSVHQRLVPASSGSENIITALVTKSMNQLSIVNTEFALIQFYVKLVYIILCVKCPY